MGWLWRQARAHLYRGNNLQQGSRSIHKGSHNEEKPNESKNYGITKRHLENTRELTGREVADKWDCQNVGGAIWPHTSSSCVGFSHGGFLSLSNLEKYISRYET
jgi:hypothetical protein